MKDPTGRYFSLMRLCLQLVLQQARSPATVMRALLIAPGMLLLIFAPGAHGLQYAVIFSTRKYRQVPQVIGSDRFKVIIPADWNGSGCILVNRVGLNVSALATEIIARVIACNSGDEIAWHGKPESIELPDDLKPKVAQAPSRTGPGNLAVSVNGTPASLSASASCPKSATEAPTVIADAPSAAVGNSSLGPVVDMTKQLEALDAAMPDLNPDDALAALHDENAERMKALLHLQLLGPMQIGTEHEALSTSRTAVTRQSKGSRWSGWLPGWLIDWLKAEW